MKFDGENLIFGVYDDEEIKWRILDREGSHIFVVSEKSLDLLTFDDRQEPAAWDECILRDWLNYDFMYDAFEEEELDYIVQRDVVMRENPEYDTDPGEDTEDKIFLLSIEEAEKYFKNSYDRCCVPRKVVQKQVAKKYPIVADSIQSWEWWLRTPGHDDTAVAFVNEDGFIDYYGCEANEEAGIRPAMFVEVDDDMVEKINLLLEKRKKEEKFSSLGSDDESVIKLEGDKLVLGTYENQKLKWHILEKRGLRVLAISEKTIDASQVIKDYKDNESAYNAFKNWLNSEFLDEVFSVDEWSQMYSLGSSISKNKLFIMSDEKVRKYLDIDTDGQCINASYEAISLCFWIEVDRKMARQIKALLKEREQNK